MLIKNITYAILLCYTLGITNGQASRYTPETTFSNCLKVLKSIGPDLGFFEDFDVVGCFANSDEGLRYRVTLKHKSKPIKRCLMTLRKKNDDAGFVIEKFKNGNLDCHKLLDDGNGADDM